MRRSPPEEFGDPVALLMLVVAVLSGFGPGTFELRYKCLLLVTSLFQVE